MTLHMEIRICGLGGQGIVLASQVLAWAAVLDGRNVVQTQSYGAEARGSAAKGEVIISTEKIGFPLVRNCDIMVAMSQSALDAYVKDLKESGTLLVDDRLITKISDLKVQLHELPFITTAERNFQSKLYANMIMLGTLARITNIVSNYSLEKAVSMTVKAETVTQNLQAVKLGWKLLE